MGVVSGQERRLPDLASAGYSLRSLRRARCWGLTRFDNLFETTQILVELLCGERLKEVRYCYPHYAAWWCVFEPYLHFSATAIREFLETYGADMLYVRPRQRTR